MTKLIQNANIVLEDRILENSALLIRDETIAAIGEAALRAEGVEQVIDAKGLYVGPGFVDIHVHGGGSAMFYDDPMKAARHFLSHGETTLLPTLYYLLNPAEFAAAIRTIQAAMKQEPLGKAMAGFYMEGPYMNPKFGASADNNRWKGAVRKEDYQAILELAAKDALVWAVAPEREGVRTFMEDAKKVNPDTIFAVGHSEATPTQIAALKSLGIRVMTHCMDATGRTTEWLGTRGAGPDEACLLDDDFYAEMICDSTCAHVCPDLQKLILKVKGIDKVVLISDSFVSENEAPPHLQHITDLSFDEDGNLSGSKLTLDVACRNFRAAVGASMPEAFKAAALNPAKLLGLDHRIGSIAEGKTANLIFCTEDFDIQKIIFYGNELEKECI